MKWDIPKLWPGETVAIIAGGPSVNQSLADSVRQHKRIVVNHAYMLPPDADMLLALDSDPEFFGLADVAHEALDVPSVRIPSQPTASAAEQPGGLSQFDGHCRRS